MKPFFERDGVALYHGDCREILPSLGAKSVDLVLTDPPYEVEAHTLQRRGSRGAGARIVVKPLGFAAMDEATRCAVSAQLGRVARRWVLTFCQVEAAPTWRVAQEAGGLVYKRTCLWIKPDGQPQLTGDRPGMGYETILAMHSRGRSRWNGGGEHGVWTVSKRCGNGANVHPTEKPLALMGRLVLLFSDQGDLVLDPFAGSGSTLVAARENGRRAIGIEREEKFCEIAASRLDQMLLFDATQGLDHREPTMFAGGGPT